MPRTATPRPASLVTLRQDPGARRAIAAWRRLTGGRRVRDAERPTLVACSAGADSAALAIALAAAAPRSITIAHIRHDLRPPGQTAHDRDAAATLADRLAVPFMEAAVHIAAERGNAEGNARRARYRELARLASEAGCRYVATAHHADDQLETAIMRALLRGCAPGALAGVRESRPLTEQCTLIRPMLALTRADTERLCALFGFNYVTDETNADRSRLRARVRAEVMPTLRAIAPDAAVRAAPGLRMWGETHDVLQDAARALRLAAELGADATEPETVRLARPALRTARPIVVQELLRMIALERTHRQGAARLHARTLQTAAQRIISTETDPACLLWHAVAIEITAHHVRIRPRTEKDARP